MKRLVIVAVCTFFLFTLLIVQFFKIQIVEGEKWTNAALAQHEYIVTVPYQRGAFLSNTSVKKGHPERVQPFVVDVTKFHLYIDPESIPERCCKEIACRLAAMTSYTPEEFLPEFQKQSRSRKLAMWLERGTKEQILSWWYPYARKEKIANNAVFFITDYKRSYPFGRLLGQVLHTIREVKEEKTQEAVPTGGLEAYFNDYLKGKVGQRRLLRSPLNSFESDKIIESPEDGADIHLTINHCIQAIAEEELEKGVKAAQAKGGWVVMMDPFTGEILAMAQYPSFDPANYREYFNDPLKLEAAKVKSVTDCFEPGSIMKPITVAICLQASEMLKSKGKPPLFIPEEKIDTTRTSFPGRGSKPLHDVTSTRALNMAMAIQKSSNIYMAQIIDRLMTRCGAQWYRSALVDIFGFGQKTKIELPGEAPGLVPRPGFIHPNGTLEWSLATPYSLCFGHNVLATSLQMARAYSVIANGGYLVEPTLVRKITKQNREEILVDHTNRDRVKGFPRVLSSEVAKEVLRAMKYSTKLGGTGHLAEINGYTEAGKTGTAEKVVEGQYSKEKYISSFIGISPANMREKILPRFVLAVSIDEPAHIVLEGGGRNYRGGRCAAPIFREIARRTFEYLGIEPDDPYGYPPGDPRHDPKLADWGPEVQELKKLFEEWNRK